MATAATVDSAGVLGATKASMLERLMLGEGFE